MDHFERFRTHFPVLTQYTYLNTAAWGLLHDGLLEWRQEYDLDFLIGGSLMKMEALKVLEQTRGHLGRFFNCPADRISLCPNFSLGLNILLEGLQPRSRVLLLEGDYPSLNWPFETRDFSVKTLSHGGEPEAKILESLAEGPADVLALSLVQWVDGLLVSPKFLKDLKASHPDLIIIADATQFAGAFMLDFEDSGIDVLGASGYKWLLGGNGNGFFLFSQGAESRFGVRATGFNAVAPDLSRKHDIPFPRKLEPGHLDTLSFGSLDYSLSILETLGMEEVDRYNRELSRKVKEALGSLSLLDDTLLQRQSHSTIYNIPDPGGRYDHLKEEGIVCSFRGGGIRLSFHCYNTLNDLDRLVDVLKSGPGAL
jgi:selenocysteine lyase/cysteine desulfurase